ncbi:polyprenyl synthetase family protein [Streptomyces fructofermentans]|uniref:Polyprenyl synthetase n=1 Tax=Streptomyces fructofermentans TaxID=152141 RepID=A0A918KBK5_9ACTN|nr:polyprenyl synthetase family protein [Streptomyces fructofermentans]GGX56573.1 polyprenyl synthetase [Streptomyces fructofermentans]
MTSTPTPAPPLPIAYETSPDGPRLLSECRSSVRPALAAAVGRLHPWVGEMAAYSLGWCEAGGAPSDTGGGKGLRQALAVLGARAAGAPRGAGVTAAVAVELVHTFSLLHDDIMDGDATRRGRPTAWKAYGTGAAVLAGDALLALAVETVAGAPGPHVPAAVRHLSAALHDLVLGQADDLLFETRPWTGPDAVGPGEYRTMAERKTGALLGCATSLGAVLAGAPATTVASLDRAGRHLGVAFQVADDVLGVWGDPAVTGKPVHSDLRRRKKTFPVLSALGTSAGASLGRLLSGAEDLDEAGARRAATAVEEAGGRAAALAEARRHLAVVDACLEEAAPAPRTAADLRALLSFLVHRDR